MKFPLIITVIFFSFHVSNVSAQGEFQDPGYQWARLSNVVNEFRGEGIRTSFNNDIFTSYWYIDTIYIEDTSFIHPGGFSTYQDFHVAIVKRDTKGNFIKACDFFTPQNDAIFNIDIEIDNESNIIVYGAFQDTLYINGYSFTIPGNVGPNLFLVKLNDDFDVIWGRTISSPYQDECGNLAISEDNYYYLTANHMYPGTDTLSRVAFYLGQDSAYVHDGLNSLLKIDSDGNLIWRKEIHDPHIGHASVWNTVIGQDNHIYLYGNATNDIMIEGDTLKHPTYPDYWDCGFIIQFDEEGNHHKAFFTDKHLDLFYHQLEIDRYGNYYLSGIFWDSLDLGNELLTVQEDSIAYIIFKTDTSFVGEWYECIKRKITGGPNQPRFIINLNGDSLAFAFSITGSFTFAGIYFNFGYSGEVLSGIFNPDGDLISYQSTNSTGASSVFWMRVDNCGNLIFDGRFTGTGFFGEDTLVAADPYSLYLVKNNRIPPISLEMPTDTTGCGQVTLYAPEGYLYYQWNDEPSGQNWMIVDNSTIINVKAANEDGCWSEAETIVNIYPDIEFSLGYDTTIQLTDTLELSVPAGYENYFWSTGDTTSYLVIPATDLQIGNNLIWIEINNGFCYASDTILVKVIDNLMLYENERPDILIYPNPAKTNFQIIFHSGKIPETISIYNCDGKRVLIMHPTENLIIRSLEHGVYIVELDFLDFTIKRKLIVL